MSKIEFKMSCMGQFLMDRTCELCKNVSPSGYSDCRELRSLKLHNNRCSKSYKLTVIEEGTDPNYGFDSSDKVIYWMCGLHSREDKVECRPTVECLKYCNMKED